MAICRGSIERPHATQRLFTGWKSVMKCCDSCVLPICLSQPGEESECLKNPFSTREEPFLGCLYNSLAAPPSEVYNRILLAMFSLEGSLPQLRPSRNGPGLSGEVDLPQRVTMDGWMDDGRWGRPSSVRVRPSSSLLPRNHTTDGRSPQLLLPERARRVRQTDRQTACACVRQFPHAGRIYP